MIYIPGTSSRETRVVDGVEINTYINKIGELGNSLGIEAGTNVYWGESGRIFFGLSDLGGANLQAMVDKNVFVENGDGTIAEIMISGDSGIRMFIKSLRWTLDTIECLWEYQRQGDIL